MALHILIVEDERIIAEDIKSMIESPEYHVTEIVDAGEQALQSLSRVRADIVLMDIKLQDDMDGLEAAEQIYSQFGIPVVYLTAYADSATIEHIKETAAYGFIVKPASRQTIQGTLELAIYKHDMDRRLRERDERLEHLNRVLRAIRNVNQLITQEADPVRLIQGACAHLAGTLGYRRAWIALVDQDGRPVHFGQAGVTDSFHESTDLFREDQWVACAASALGSSDLAIIRHPSRECRSCPFFQADEPFSRFGKRLEFAGKVYGLLSVAVSPEFAEDAEERKLFQELADDIAFALYRIELEDKKSFAETMLLVRERTLSTLMNNLPGMAYRCLADDQWTMMFVSGGCLSLTGYWPDDLIDNGKLGYQDLIHPEDRDAVREAVLHPAGETRQFEIRYRIRIASGDERWVWERGCYTGEQVEGYDVLEGVIHDITEQVKAEESLKESEARYRALVEHMIDSVFLVDRDSRILSVNQAAARLLRRKPGEIAGKCVNDLFPGELAQKYLASIHRVFETGEPLVVERKTILPDREIWLVATLSPIKNEKGDITAVIGVSRDITGRKQAEEALRESETHFRTLVDASPAGIFMTDAAGGYRFVNPRWCVMTGLTLEEARGDGWKQGLYPDDRDAVFANWQKMIKNRGAWSFQYRLQDREGKRTWVESVAAELRDENQKITGYLGTNIDITERRIAEEAVRENEERYRQLFEAESDAIFLIDNETGLILEANRAASELYGYTHEELLGKKNVELSDQPDETRRVTETTPVREDSVIRIPLRLHRKKDGTVFSVEIMGRFFEWKGRPVHIAAIRDVTDRLKAEEALRREKERFEKITETSPIGITVVDKHGFIVFANSKAEEILHLSKEEIRDRRYNSPEWRITDEAGLAFPDEELPFNRVRETGEAVVGVRHAIRWPDGTMRLISISAAPIVDEEKNFESMVALIEDVTEQEKTHRELTDRGIFIQTILVHLPVGVALNTIDSGEATYVNRKFEETYGWSSDVIKDVARFFECVWPDPEEREAARSRIMADIGSGDPDRMKWENIAVTQQDGERKVVSAKNIPLPAQNLMISTVWDVTPLHQAKEALEEKIRELRQHEKNKGRNEKKILALKQEVNALCTRLGLRRKYRIPRDP